MKIKVTTAEGAALDWAVAKCEEHAWAVYDYAVYNEHAVIPPRPSEYLRDNRYGPEFSPSTDWAQGGPIIERERINLIQCQSHCGQDHKYYWEASLGYEDEPNHHTVYDQTPLIAAMRTLVASKLGGEVEIPEELI